MIRLITVLIALLSPWGCMSLPQPASEPVSLSILQAHGLIFLEVDWAGRRPLVALVDTGANASAIDPLCSGDLPVLGKSEVVGTTGTMDVETVVVERLHLGSWNLPALHATRRDLRGLLAPEDHRIDMILGSDAFSSRVVTLDFVTSQIEVSERPPTDLEWSIPMILDDGIPAIEAEIGGIGEWLRIDTGASLFETEDLYINVPTRTWRALQTELDGIKPSTHFQGTGLDGRSVNLPVAPVPEAWVGPRMFDRVFVIVQPETGYFADPNAKGFLSNNFLRQLGRVALDFKTGQFWGKE